MRRTARHSLVWYAFAVVAVAAATLLTLTIPVLRDRLTFFAYWPVIFIVAWLGGVGPGLVSSLLAAVAVVSFLPLQGFHGTPVALAVTVGVFVVAGASACFLALWRTRIEQHLRESRDLFRTLANSAPVLIRMTGADGECTFFNDRWLEFTGSTLERAIAAGWLASVHPDDRQGCEQAFRAAVEERRPFSLDYRLRRYDGTYRSVLDHGLPRHADDGAFLGVIASCVDITEQREALVRARGAAQQAEQASRAKDAFLATVSHELRTPLSPILAWGRMLKTGNLDSAQTARAIDVIVRNAQAQAQLVEDLLDVSRIVEGRLRLNIRPVALAGIVEGAVETVRTAADAKGIRLQVILDTVVAPIAGDPDRLQQVIWNLVSNAVKFTPNGGRVHIVLERVNSHVEIAVSDSGQGIAREKLPHLFERFWQADPTTSRAHGGLGLGLAIVRHLVELHGGTVIAESPGEGLGSTFSVKLPILPFERKAGEEQRRHPILLDQHLEGAADVDLHGIRILVVDDEPDSNESMSILLGRFGAEVRVAASVSQAMEILGRWLPDVIVSDVGMPVEDGYALIAKVRARTDRVGTVPAIALTAYAAVDDRIRLLSSGFQLHVAKPAEPAEIVAAIKAVLRRS